MTNLNLDEKFDRREFLSKVIIASAAILSLCILASAEGATTNTLVLAQPEQEQELRFEGLIRWDQVPIPLASQSEFVNLKFIAFDSNYYTGRKHIDIYYRFLDDKIEELLFTAEFFNEQGELLGKRLVYQKRLRSIPDYSKSGKKLWDPPLRNGAAEIHLTENLLDATSYRIEIKPVWPQEEGKILNEIRNYYHK